jgi:putative hydrolase of the HAD superfamily
MLCIDTRTIAVIGNLQQQPHQGRLSFMKPLPDFLLLDLDDTIINYTASGDQCWENLCASFASKLNNISSDQLLAAINQSRTWFWSDPERHHMGRFDLKSARRMVVANAFHQLQIDHCEVSEELADSFTTLREELVQPFPGSVETLRRLHDRGIRMALITNGKAEFQRNKIHRFGLKQYFDFILIESEFGVGKPDPRVFQYALEQFCASPAQVWMIGDDLEFDICPAQALGMDTVWVNPTNTSLPTDRTVVPTQTVSSLAELVEE